MALAADRLLWRVVALSLLVATVGGAADHTRRLDENTTQPTSIAKPLIAYWTFDERAGGECLDASGNGCAATTEGRADGVQKATGLFGNAVGLSGRHMLRAPGKPEFGPLAKISLSAWVMPTDLSEYREIFRKEDDANRVLFSFQNNGRVLSLGLNIGGYVECDAKIDPAQVLDGDWHHCAATFDGKRMRVYLDGKEVAALARKGPILAGGMAPGCIGSANGGECFQGMIDDLRIYKDALTPEEVARLHRNGLDSIARMSENPPAGEPKIERPLLAHWTFNEMGAAISDASGNLALRLKAPPTARRMRGVHGRALDLRSEHGLKADAGFLATRPSKITFAAWARPADLKGFREIFRQECPERMLFSFQENGTVLSLGLNVGGYVECDAAVTPAQVVDGQWHHCAGTFDGERMRVYLDGKQVGALQRRGAMAAVPSIPCFIGSLCGKSEHFQGGLDDLRIYGDALTAEEVSRLHAQGRESLLRFARKMEEDLCAFYAPAASFAETLANSRKNLAEKAIPLDDELARAFTAKMRSSFLAECQEFVAYVGADPVAYLTSKGNDFHFRECGRLVELLFEYRPLTPHQKAKETEQDRRKWQEAEAVQAKVEALKARGDSVQFSPDWIRLILEAGRKIQFRPFVSEAVAPYVTPQTPPTRALSAAEAREALERDWMHQADRNPSPERIKSEIEWARQLAARIRAQSPGKADLSPELAALGEVENQVASLSGPDSRLYFRTREIKRRILFKNPVVDFAKVLFVDMPFPQGREWAHETRHRLGYMAVPGARLLILDGLSPEGKLIQIMPQPPLHGSFWRPDLSYDAQKILFCFKPHNEKSFHLYEIAVDGSGLTQLTDGPYDDLDPIYLPDDRHLLFSTTRGHTYVRCMPPTNAYVLARCDRDGGNIYLVSCNNEPDYLPSVMNDGRVVYTRWEYTDKPLWRAQGLWTIHPDGTQVNALWGNQSVWPDLLKDARNIPDSRRIMFTGSAHHGWFSGSVGIVNPDEGFNFPNGLRKVTADVAWPESGNGPVDPVESPTYHRSGAYSAYYSPYPLSEQDFLVSANRGGKFVLYLMDVDGNREMVYEGEHNILHALPVRPRPKPPIMQDKVEWPTRENRLRPSDGIIYSGNVYHGAPEELRGKARFLRVLSIDHKTYTYWHKRPYLSTGPVVSAVQSEGVKRLLGTVPIEQDGSVAFHAPSGKPLHFQLLDGEQRALQTMRSFAGLMPGERRGCLGCHELHSATPEAYAKPIALSKPPQEIPPPPWSDNTVSYARYVRPVLDRYCGKCHQGEGEGRKTFDMTPRAGALDFDETYWLLTGRPTWAKPYEQPQKPPPGWGIADMIMVEAYRTTDPVAYQTPKPMTRLSYKSRLIERVSSGKHHGVKVDPVSLLRLIVWVDAMCPYRGDEEIREIPDPEFQGVDWLAVRPRIHTAPRIVRPGPVD